MAKLKFTVKNAQLQKIFKQDAKENGEASSQETAAEAPVALPETTKPKRGKSAKTAEQAPVLNDHPSASSEGSSAQNKKASDHPEPVKEAPSKEPSPVVSLPKTSSPVELSSKESSIPDEACQASLPSKSAHATHDTAHKPYQARPSYPPRDTRPERAPQMPRDSSRPSSYPPRDGQSPRPSYPPRDGNSYSPRDGNSYSPRPSYPPRDGQSPRPAYPPRDGNTYAPRDGQSPRPAYPSRDGQSPRPAYPPRDGQSPRPSYPPRDGNSYSPRPSYPPRDGQSPRPAYPPRDGNTYAPRDGQSPRPAYPPRDGNTYAPRDGQSPRPSYPPRDGQSPRPSYPPRDGQSPRPYTPREGNYPRADGGNYPRSPRPFGGQAPTGAPGYRRPYGDSAPRPEGQAPYPRTPRYGDRPGAPVGGGSAPYPRRPGSAPFDRSGAPPRPRPPFGGAPRFGAPTALPPGRSDKGENRRAAPQDFKAKRDTSSDRDWKEQKQSQKSFDSRQRHGFDLDSEEETWIKRKNAAKRQGMSDNDLFLRPKEISVSMPILVKDLAQLMKIKASEIISKMFSHQIIMTINDAIDDPLVAELIGDELGCKVRIDTSAERRLKVVEETLMDELAKTDPSQLILRPPIATVMGHVDHGKTSLIDFIRKSNRVSMEAGAITQHMGAFCCHTDHGDITFIDTPGHAAFSGIRSRGAKITDIVVLVIAGDEGMMPQTEESIKVAKEAGLPIVVAATKCDKPAFDIEKIYRQLAEKELLPEAWGGQTIVIRCSSATGEGIPEFLEMLALQSEILELKANPNLRARGTVLESKISKGMGTCVTLLVQNGTLKLGDALIFEKAFGRVKTMQDELGVQLKEALPGHAVLVTGITAEEPPSAGSEFVVAKNEKDARRAVEARIETLVKESVSKSKKATYQQMFERHTELQKKKVLSLIIKCDVQGSVDAIRKSLDELPQSKIEINLIDASLGEISESDIERAANTSAILLGFHVGIESHAESFIKTLQVKVKTYDIIYRLIDDVKAMMYALLDKIKEEVECGTATIKAIFKSSQQGKIAGCMVTEGTVRRACLVKVIRNKEIIWEGSVHSLKRMQDDVKEINKGFECGIVLNGFQDIEVEDQIKFFDIIYKNQEL